MNNYSIGTRFTYKNGTTFETVKTERNPDGSNRTITETFNLPKNFKITDRLGNNFTYNSTPGRDQWEDSNGNKLVLNDMPLQSTSNFGYRQQQIQTQSETNGSFIRSHILGQFGPLFTFIPSLPPLLTSLPPVFTSLPLIFPSLHRPLYYPYHPMGPFRKKYLSYKEKYLKLKKEQNLK